MDGSGLFILRARKVKRVNGKGQAEGKDARKERKIGLAETLSDRHICHIDQQITTVYIGGKESSPSTGKRHPRVHRKLFRYPTLYTVRVNRMNVYVITGGSSVTHNTSLRLRVRFHVHRNAPCQYAPDEYRSAFCGPYSKVSPARAYPCNLVYLRIVFIRVSTINWPLESFKVASIARADDLEMKFYINGHVASIEVI